MNHVFHRSANVQPPRAVAGQGIYIFDADGRRYIDACGGAAVSCLGHGDPEVIEMITAQAQRLAYAHTSFFTTDAAEELADLLVSDAPAGMERVYFVCDGSEAVETALKMAHQYHRERGETGRTHIIARRQSYHGNTLGALSVGGNALRRAAYREVMVPTVSHIEPCWDYRLREERETPDEYGRRAADLLEAEILRIGPDRVSCFMAETVVGATLGCVPPAPGYFRWIREICDRYGVLFVLDEIMCGMGRTGTLHACEQEGVAPDIMVVAKGLGAGYVPLGAALCSGAVFDAFAAGSGAFVHGQTFVGHPVACASALAVQRAVRRRGLVEAAARQGERLAAALDVTFSGNPHVGDVRGRGLFMALEMVEDRAAKTPFAPARKVHAAIRQEAMRRGLLVYAMGGTIDGVRGDHVMLAPPYTISDGETDAVVDILAQAVEAALA